MTAKIYSKRSYTERRITLEGGVTASVHSEASDLVRITRSHDSERADDWIAISRDHLLAIMDWIKETE